MKGVSHITPAVWTNLGGNSPERHARHKGSFSVVSNDRDRSRGAAAPGLARSDYWWVGVEGVGVGWRSGWYNLAKVLSAP